MLLHGARNVLVYFHMDVKTIISTIAVILALIGYIPYYRDTLSGKTTPHIYTWFIWGFATAVIFALQITGGAGVGSWVTLAAVILSFGIFFSDCEMVRKISQNLIPYSLYSHG